MKVSDAVMSRRSMRAFTDEPVPLETLTRVLEKARWTPSGCNFQPWRASILTGEPLKALQAKMMASEPQDPIESSFSEPNNSPMHLARLQELGAALYGSMGIEREDKEARDAFTTANIHSFGAPAVLFCHFERFMGPPQWSDVGMWLQTIMLLLREEGLHSCPQEWMALFARVIKEHIGVSDETNILFCGLAIGHGKTEEPMNQFERARVPLSESVTFVGF